MRSPVISLRRADRPRVPRQTLRGFAAIVCALFLGACSALPELTFDVGDVPPLKLDGQLYRPEEVSVNLRPEDVLALTQEMRDFVETQASGSGNSRTRLMTLHWAIKSQGILGMRYDPFADGNARQAFERGTANCLSYAHMFIALAREAGLKARYQWMEVRPEWQRMGERVAVRLHVNVQVRMRDGTEYTVDIDPLNQGDVAGTRVISDEEGLALHYNNIAMNALAVDRPVEAWRQIVRGLEVAPELSQLWVNLGAIYRFSGQYAEAEQAYFRALDIDRGDRSAMNNLVVLYETQGRDNEREYWVDRLTHYRNQNPYYHASLGDTAMEAGDWEAAYRHYDRARRLQPDDGQLVYTLGLVEHRRGNFKEAERLIERAIDKAAFQVVKERYRIQLRSIREEQAASL